MSKKKIYFRPKIFGVLTRVNGETVIKIHDTDNAFGNLNVRKYLRGGHYHIIVDTYDDHFLSVGLTSDKPGNKKNQKLHKVYESNGKVARMKRSVTNDKKIYYKKNNACFNVDIESELKAIDKVINKKRNTNSYTK